MKISSESVITRTKFRLGLQDSTLWDAYIEKLIYEAARHLDAVSSYIISCTTLTVDCHRAKLPDDFVEVVCVKMVTPSDTCSCNNVYDPATDPSSNGIYSSCTCGQYYIADRGVLTAFCGLGYNGTWYGNVFDTQNGYFILPDTNPATEVQIWYRGLNVDENGLMILDDFQERGLSAYAAYQFANSGSNYKAYDNQQRRLWLAEANAQINKIRGKAAQNDHNAHINKFASIARSFLINPMQSQNANL